MAASRTMLRCKSYDAVVIGGGHNGLVAAAYLAKSNKKVAVFERRHVLGGAAVTEEIVPDFKFSRASYLLSLLRPAVVKELELKKHGLKIYLRDPNSYTPLINSRDYLLLSSDMTENKKEISKFSQKDAEAYEDYEDWLNRLAVSLDPILDHEPVDLLQMTHPSKLQQLKTIRPLMAFGKTLSALKQDLGSFYDLIQSPAAKILDRWFESEPLKATLATDSVIGAMLSPHQPGSGYVLLHHVMGELEGQRNAWGYAEGGMGGVSSAIARAAQSHGAELFTSKTVTQILVEDGQAKGILLEDGEHVEAKVVLSNATPKVTFLDLLPQPECLGEEFKKLISQVDYSSGVTKINVALSGLPNFLATPHTGREPAPHHRGTIHLNTESVELIHQAYVDSLQGHWSRRPMLELCLPSTLDPTLAPPGCHVLSIFSQYTPYTLHTGPWTEQDREDYANCVFDSIEAYAPGFRQLVVGKEVLTPPDLERIFGLTGGNIFHGAMSVDQLYMSRPTYRNPAYSSPLPGGGVMGAPGRLAALSVLKKSL